MVAEGASGETSAEEAERNRRRRRRRRRRGGERPPNENGIAADAPQPTDDGLAVVAEIGGDFSTLAPPLRSEEESVDENGRPNGPRRRRSRRGRRGERDRFAAPGAEGGDDALAEVTDEAGDPEAALEAPALAEPPLAEPEELPWTTPRNVEVEVSVRVEPEIQEEPTPAEANAAPEPHEMPPYVEAVAHEPPAPPPVEAHEEAAERHIAAEAPPAPEPEPAVEEDPNRPRRTGWWQRARASIVGE
jgi:ribonuclease E